MNYYINKDDHLEHHGILGQKWGVRRYQNKDGSYTAAGKEHRNQGSIGNVKNGEVSALQVAELTAYVATAVAVNYYTKQRVKKESEKENKILEKNLKSNEVQKLSDVNKIEPPMATKDSVKVVNPDYPADGTMQNCTFCTVAMSLREKGYDVEALKTNDGFMIRNVMKQWYPDVKEGRFMTILKTSGSTTNSIYNKLEKQPEGSYGNLSLCWWCGGGHSVFYKIENGQAKVYDAQSGKVYNREAFKKEFAWGISQASDCTFYRLDNVEPSDMVLSSVTNRRKGE